MRIRLAVLGLVLSTAFAPVAAAQSGVEVAARAAYFVESYSFDDGLAYTQIEEYTWPVGINASFGRSIDLAISSGYVIVRLESALPQQLPDQRLSGLTDTEARLSYNVIPGRLVIFARGTAPTGIQTVDPQELSILGAISSDLIGFTATTLGTGGMVGGGFAGAMPVGRFALGIGGTFTNPLSYTPVSGNPDELLPGAEVRLRMGLEGPLGRRTYLRTAVMWSARRQDEVGTTTQNGVGNRIIGYAALNQGLGPGTATIFVFDVFRGSPILEPGLVGAAILPRGNLIAFGGRYDWAVGLRTTISPRGEYRISTAAASDGSSKLLLAGQTFRFGVDLRHALTRALSVALQGSGITGFVVQSGAHVGVTGYRVSLHGEWRP